MESFYKGLDKALAAILILLVAVMTGAISAEIIIREALLPLLSGIHGETPDWITRTSSPLTTVAQTALVWIGILGGAYALKQRAHIGVDAVYRLYPRRVRLILDHVSTALVLGFSFAVLLLGGWIVCARAFQTASRMPGLDALNRGWFYLVLPVTGLLNLVYGVYLFVRPDTVEAEAAAQSEGAAQAEASAPAEGEA